MNPPESVKGLLDLPFELLLDIFERLDMLELISVGRIHPHIEAVASHIIERLISDRTLKIYIRRNQLYKFEGISYSILGTDHINQPVELQTMLDLFKYYGHYITKLSAQFGEKRDYDEALISYINKYAAKTLKEIDFQRLEMFCHLLKEPFSVAEKVQLKHINAATSTLNLSEMFPSVRYLDVRAMGLIRSLNSLQHYPHLEHLTIPIEWGDFEASISAFSKLIELNPQLKHLSIPRCQWNMLELLNETRPELESLELSEFILYDHRLRKFPLLFSDIKKLKCQTIDQREINVETILMKFGSLEEIEVDGGLDFWMKVIMENRNLKKVIVRNELSRENLQRIAHGLPNLEEFTMTYGATVGHRIEGIADFLQQATQVKKATFVGLSPNQCDEAAQNLTNEWKNVENELDYCCFVRLIS